jgi:hypothetical protein
LSAVARKARNVYVGIDPGKYGAVAFLFHDRQHNYVVDMPRTVDDTDYDIPAMYDVLLAELVSPFPVKVALEQVSRPAKLTRCAGIIEGLLTAIECESAKGASHIKVLPRDWMDGLGMPTPHTKAHSLALARELYPEMAEMLGRKMDDGRAEAILLAHWLREETR